METLLIFFFGEMLVHESVSQIVEGKVTNTWERVFLVVEIERESGMSEVKTRLIKVISYFKSKKVIFSILIVNDLQIKKVQLSLVFLTQDVEPIDIIMAESDGVLLKQEILSYLLLVLSERHQLIQLVLQTLGGVSQLFQLLSIFEHQLTILSGQIHQLRHSGQFVETQSVEV